MKNSWMENGKLGCFETFDKMKMYLQWSFFCSNYLFYFIVPATENCPYKKFASNIINMRNVFFTAIFIRSIFNVFFSLFFRKISFFFAFCQAILLVLENTNRWNSRFPKIFQFLEYFEFTKWRFPENSKFRSLALILWASGSSKIGFDNRSTSFHLRRFLLFELSPW